MSLFRAAFVVAKCAATAVRSAQAGAAARKASRRRACAHGCSCSGDLSKRECRSRPMGIGRNCASQGKRGAAIRASSGAHRSGARWVKIRRDWTRCVRERRVGASAFREDILRKDQLNVYIRDRAYGNCAEAPVRRVEAGR
eukprot:3153501-Pleurochrysis_carterae.AAC.1